MKKVTIICLSLIFLISMMPSCILDPKEEKPDDNKPVEPVDWPELTEKDDVFEYITLVYEKKNYSRYPLLIDDNFTFRFGQADYDAGITPAEWFRQDDLNSASNLLNGQSSPEYGAVVQIELTLQPQGTIWTEIPKTDPPFAGETWYQKSFRYWLTATTNTGKELRGHDINAFFIIRQSEHPEQAGKMIWRIVQWNDDVAG